ncbi:hypothetical protein KM043_008064 [Ampulex compressa]|nr:hypothetical protein KM043_008064 [Ampulex compressa]
MSNTDKKSKADKPTALTLSAPTNDRSVRALSPHLLYQLEELNKAFTKEHAYFEVSRPSALSHNKYFTKNAHGEECRQYIAVRRYIDKLRHSPMEGKEANIRREATPLEEQSHELTRFPEHKAKLDGKTMPSQCLIERHTSELTAGFLLRSGSLTSSWVMLNERYENKRLFI